MSRLQAVLEAGHKHRSTTGARDDGGPVYRTWEAAMHDRFARVSINGGKPTPTGRITADEEGNILSWGLGDPPEGWAAPAVENAEAAEEATEAAEEATEAAAEATEAAGKAALLEAKRAIEQSLRFPQDQATRAALMEAKRAADESLRESKRQRRTSYAYDYGGDGRVEGTMVEFQGGYAVKCDAHSALWWYPNVATTEPYRTLNGPKLFAKKRAEPHEEVEFTGHGSDYVIKGDPNPSDPPDLKFRVGEKVRFVPYERSDILFDEDDRLIMHCKTDGKGVDYPHDIPLDCVGVATQVVG